MAQTKMIFYQHWRNRVAKKGFSDFELVSDESFQRLSRHAGTLILEKQYEDITQEMTPEMIFFKKEKKNNSEEQLVRELVKECKNQKIFRKSKIDDIKQRIQSNQYHISGKAVVDKWFSEESEL
ncbi:flagellar biosynthesis anti-sigma factor FlgM [bacterium]|nr:flagellar biosynthesis anti-sigma factor FlgM [bacterium]